MICIFINFSLTNQASLPRFAIPPQLCDLPFSTTGAIAFLVYHTSNQVINKK
ncbi:hypothetical protein ROD_25461 [Citrobacter rodentium ICC168]|uniref:Uncharacterized protein n=1 Tax=Citrobacter rodentium (strain ICC168) TaxID=637910 RepID=D2TUM0_CITRI|nr:hypothetical protein ROD_25461 [Citrobacter rodentium ICC168]